MLRHFSLLFSFDDDVGYGTYRIRGLRGVGKLSSWLVVLLLALAEIVYLAAIIRSLHFLRR